MSAPEFEFSFPCVRSFRGEHSFLSNFHPCTVFLRGEIYPSVEHAYQAAKTVRTSERNAIRQAETPGRAKRLGQQARLRDGWEGMRLAVMRELVRQKFTDQQLARLLLGTGHQLLVEENDWGDQFWGVCEGRGWNHLGTILMDTRTVLRLNLGR